MKLRNIMFRIRSINEIIDIFMIVVYLFMRIFIVICVSYVIKIDWFLKIIMYLYMLYPVYSYMFNIIFYKVVQNE